jgi:hypothetical protein
MVFVSQKKVVYSYANLLLKQSPGLTPQSSASGYPQGVFQVILRMFSVRKGYTPSDTITMRWRKMISYFLTKETAYESY